MFLLLFLLIQDFDSTDRWVMVEPPRVGARIKMPNQPFFQEQVLEPVRDQPKITVRSRSCILPNGKTNLTFVYHDETKTPSNRTQVNAVLDGAVTGAIALVNGELLRQSEFFIKVNKGRDFVYRCEIDDAKLQTSHKLKIRTRIVLVRNRLFSMNYIAEEKEYRESLADLYFDSFELIKSPSDRPPRPRVGRAEELAKELVEAKMKN